MQLYFMDNSGLRSAPEVEFKREEDLEQLICDHPQLLAFDTSESQIMLVGRQLKLSDGEYKDRFKADVLFVNADALPILVEVKRHSDTRIRREVVGQMLDYVVCLKDEANYSDLQSKFKEQYSEDDPIYRKFAEDEAFWERVSSNIVNGVMTLVFVADDITDSLSSIIKYLDVAFDKVRVYGLNIKVFKSTTDDVSVVERNFIRGDHEQKQPTEKVSWDKKKLLERAATCTCHSEIYPYLSRALDVLESKYAIKYGTGKLEASFNVWKTEKSCRMFKVSISKTDEYMAFPKSFFTLHTDFRWQTDDELLDRIFGQELLDRLPDADKPSLTRDYVFAKFKIFASDERFDAFLKRVDDLFAIATH